jgi:GGDEF domain-containing protein
VEDYNSRVAMMMLLAGCAALFAFIAVRMRDKIRRVESTYVTMSSVHDRLTDLRRREYFYDRLLLECDRARQSGVPFSVVVLRAGTDDGATFETTPVQRVVEVLEPLAKEYDWLAPIGVQEVALFAPHLTSEAASAFADDLLARVGASLGLPGVRLTAGFATYGPGLDEAGDLLGQARRTVASPGRSRPAA